MLITYGNFQEFAPLNTDFNEITSHLKASKILNEFFKYDEEITHLYMKQDLILSILLTDARHSNSTSIWSTMTEGMDALAYFEGNVKSAKTLLGLCDSINYLSKKEQVVFIQGLIDSCLDSSVQKLQCSIDLSEALESLDVKGCRSLLVFLVEDFLDVEGSCFQIDPLLQTEIESGISDFQKFKKQYFQQSLNQKYFLLCEVIQLLLSFLDD